MLRLRPYKECDAKYIINWLKDERTFWLWCAGRFEKYPITAEELNHQYRDYATEDHFYQMTSFDETGVVGHMIMRFLDSDKKNLRFGYIVVDDSKRGKGYGKEMLNLALKYAFEILKTDKVTICVFENNPTAYACYKKLGFTEVPSQDPEVYHLMNEDWSCIELEMHKEQWLNQQHFHNSL